MLTHRDVRLVFAVAWCAALAFMGLLPVRVAAAQPGWAQAQNLSQLAGRSIDHATAYDPASGDLFVAWCDDGVAEWEEILVRRYDASAGRWLPTENLSSASPTWARDGGPVVIRDSSGVILVIWTRNYAASMGAPQDGSQVVARQWDGAWSPEQVIMDGTSYLPGSPGTYGLIPVETPAGTLLYITWDRTFRLASFNAGAWSAPSAWDGLDVELADVISAQDGTLHAAAFGPNSRLDNPWYQDAYYLSSTNGLDWSEEVNLSSFDGVASSIALALDAQDRIHFLWCDPDYFASDESLKSAIWERVFSDGAWGPNVAISSGPPNQAINSLSLAADQTGTLHLGWSEGLIVGLEHTDLDIYYRSGDGDGWGPAERVYQSSQSSRYPVIALADKTPYLVWQEIDTGATPQPEHEIYAAMMREAVTRFAYYLPLVVR